MRVVCNAYIDYIGGGWYGNVATRARDSLTEGTGARDVAGNHYKLILFK